MLKILTCDSKEFLEYGTFLGKIADDIVKYLKDKSPMPKEKNIYVRDDLEMRKLASSKAICEEVYGFGNMQTGYCNGYNSKLNCLEYHTCPEVDIAATDLVLLLAKQEDVKSGVIDSKKVKAFLLKEGEAVILNPYIFHFSPCKTTKEGFKCAIILSDGTNRNLNEKPNDPKLWKENKWLFAHKDTEQASLGAYIGIIGENIEVPCQ